MKKIVSQNSPFLKSLMNFMRPECIKNLHLDKAAVVDEEAHLSSWIIKYLLRYTQYCNFWNFDTNK